MKIIYIFYGYLNILKDYFQILNFEKKKLYKKRLDICLICEYLKKSLNQCNICKCFVKAKTKVDYDIDKNGKSIDGCPIKKW